MIAENSPASVTSWWHSSPTLVGCLIAGNAGPVVCDIECNATLVNCTLVGNTGSAGVGGVYSAHAVPLIVNCILWNDAEEELHGTVNDQPVVQYSDVKGGWPGFGNIDADPLFVDPGNGDYHLAAGSPCIDAGCNWSVPPDFADLDDDGDTTEITPLDLDGEGRFFDDPNTPDTGAGNPPIVDMGAYELGDSGPLPCPGDLDGDRVVDEADLSILLSAWRDSPAGDLNCDGDTDEADLGVLLANWGTVCP